MSNSKQQKKFSTPFDFDEWAELASNDPAEFEQRRQMCIEHFFSTIPTSRQRRLRGLQFRIDAERQKARTPLGACIKLSSMMWDSITGDNGFVPTIKRLIDPNSHTLPKLTPAQHTSAKILSFSEYKLKH